MDAWTQDSLQAEIESRLTVLQQEDLSLDDKRDRVAALIQTILDGR